MLIDLEMESFELFFIDDKTKLPRIAIVFGEMDLKIEKSAKANIIAMKSQTFDIEYYQQNKSN